MPAAGRRIRINRLQISVSLRPAYHTIPAGRPSRIGGLIAAFDTRWSPSNVDVKPEAKVVSLPEPVYELSIAISLINHGRVDDWSEKATLGQGGLSGAREELDAPEKNEQRRQCRLGVIASVDAQKDAQLRLRRETPFNDSNASRGNIIIATNTKRKTFVWPQVQPRSFSRKRPVEIAWSATKSPSSSNRPV